MRKILFLLINFYRPIFWRILFRRFFLGYKEKLLKPCYIDNFKIIEANLKKVINNKLRDLKPLFPQFNNLSPFSKEILKDADQISHHHFKFLGLEIKQKAIDWHTDFRSGTTWPLDFITEIKYGQGGNDIKTPWELSRFQHLSILSQAYFFTNDEKYSQEFIDQITDWLTKNPVYFGSNWRCPMDVAIRVCNWLYAWQFFKSSPSITKEFKNKFTYAIYEHGDFIYHNLENFGLKSNHYLSDIVGLVYIGILFPHLKKSQKWLKFAIKELELEIQHQVYSDGADFEGSIPYHRLVTELFTYSAILCRLNNVKLSENYWKKLKKMFEFIMYYTGANGLAPQIGDNDNGRLHILSNYYDWEVNDHRYLLSIGAVLFNRSDFKKIAGKFWDEAYWLLGEKGLAKFNGISVSTQKINSKLFPDCGICVMKHQDWQITIDAGRNGQDGNGGHGHNDTLSFTLQAFGEDIIIDPGTYLYTPDPIARNRFRSTQMHNTVTVDNQEINRFVPETLFSVKEDAVPKILDWKSNEQEDIFIVEHTGYNRLPEPVIHRREFKFNKNKKELEIIDLFTGEGEHQLEWNFHFTKHIKLIPKYKQTIEIIGNKGKVQLTLPLGA